jgi:hypothetical protein
MGGSEVLSIHGIIALLQILYENMKGSHKQQQRHNQCHSYRYSLCQVQARCDDDIRVSQFVEISTHHCRVE